MIKIEKVNKYFNRFRKNSNHVINNTSLIFEDTGLVALLGPSGSGKTTLLNAVGGLDKVNSGKIYIDNKKITSHFSYKVDKIRNLNIGYIFQDYKLVDNLSVFDNVALSLKTIGIKDKKTIEERVNYVLEKVGMHRYRKRPAAMLSGGERQRVGIARAIVKNPKIIIADEPTGNLDSKNSIEIMNIIKKISEDRLVILVTHEVNLAKFYAARIIEIEDGKVINDYKNDHDDSLDYAIDNDIYLLDMPYADKEDKLGIHTYRDVDSKINLEIVLKGNNIFIKSIDGKKIEVVDDNSSVEFFDAHYTAMNKSDLKNLDFDFETKLKNPKRLRYSSIFNPLTFISNGINKVLNYSFIKKLLLIGFFLSGFFIMMSSARIAANLKVNDSDFVDTNKNYLKLIVNKYNADDFNNYANSDNVIYALPGDSRVTFKLNVDDYYQTARTPASFTGSISTVNMINSKSLILGRMPENDHEIVIDKMVVSAVKKNIDVSKMIGLNTNADFLNRKSSVDNMDEFTIVGISDTESPSIYVNENQFINLLYNTTGENDYGLIENNEYYNYASGYQDYKLFENKVTLKEGTWSNDDYSVVVNIENKFRMPLNKEISDKINGRKLKVVGYYETEDGYDYMFVNNNMIKTLLINKSSNIVIYPKDKTQVLEDFRDNKKLNIQDSYLVAKNKYLQSRHDATKAAITSSIIVLIISTIEIVLMLRSSFLSRIKEVGIYRAIGLKKKDIYIMFSGEILAITTMASIPGILMSAYIFDRITHITYLKGQFLINNIIILGAILFIYAFNLVCGLFPVFFTLRKTPAQILSRTDAD